MQLQLQIQIIGLRYVPVSMFFAADATSSTAFFVYVEGKLLYSVTAGGIVGGVAVLAVTDEDGKLWDFTFNNKGRLEFDPPLPMDAVLVPIGDERTVSPSISRSTRSWKSLPPIRAIARFLSEK